MIRTFFLPVLRRSSFCFSLADQMKKTFFKSFTPFSYTRFDEEIRIIQWVKYPYPELRPPDISNENCCG